MASDQELLEKARLDRLSRLPSRFAALRAKLVAEAALAAERAPGKATPEDVVDGTGEARRIRFFYGSRRTAPLQPCAARAQRRFRRTPQERRAASLSSLVADMSTSAEPGATELNA